ncbi:hypothetical protein SUGI_0856200 [Cryptomeria japonica]|nr:hypothetical protein SUGI_0856200 [Cryptomeria japonica]
MPSVNHYEDSKFSVRILRVNSRAADGFRPKVYRPRICGIHIYSSHVSSDNLVKNATFGGTRVLELSILNLIFNKGCISGFSWRIALMSFLLLLLHSFNGLLSSREYFIILGRTLVGPLEVPNR